MSWQRRAAERLAQLSLRLAPESRREWAQAMVAELDAVKGDWAALAWACGGLRVIFMESLRAQLSATGKAGITMSRPRLLSSIGAGVLILALLWLAANSFGAWRRHSWYGDAQATVVSTQTRQVNSAGRQPYLCEAVLKYDAESSRVTMRRYLAEDASSRDRWLNKWASGTHHWLHYWRSAPDEVVWQDDPAWAGYFGRIPSDLHMGLGVLVLGAGMMLLGKKVHA